MDKNDEAVELERLTALGLAARFASGSTSPIEAAQLALERIGRLNPKFNAYCFVDAQAALASAAQSAQRWQEGTPLSAVDGVPTGIKDNIDVGGWPTRRGSRITSLDLAAQDAPVVANLRRAGCVFVGKTTMPEFGWKGVTDSPLTGTTCNPLRPSLTPGGSSGGAAAALLIGGTPIQIGTDGGGSIRIPAAFTGVFGLKPSAGHVPVHPIPALGSLFHIGPLTRTTDDAAAVLAILALEPSARPPVMHRWTAAKLSGLRVAVAVTLPHVANIDAEITGAVYQAAKALARQGALVKVAAPPIDAHTSSAWEALWWDAAAKTVASFGVGREVACDPGLQAGIAKGLAQDTGVVAAALAHVEVLKRAMARIHDDYDVLLTPPVTCRPFEIGFNVPPCGSYGQNWWDWAPFCQAFNLTGQPAIVVPVGCCSQGLPLCVQVSGSPATDMTILAVAAALEKSFAPTFPRL